MSILTCAIFGDEWERFITLVLDGMSPLLSWVKYVPARKYPMVEFIQHV